MNPGKTILTVIFAASAGLLTGLLFAPKKGARTRRRILEKGEDTIDDMMNSVNHTVRVLRNQLNDSCTASESGHKEPDRQNTDMY